MKIRANTVTLSTGRQLAATELSPFRRGVIDGRWEDDPSWIFDGGRFTQAERKEIVDGMIHAWTQWRKELSEAGPASTPRGVR
jgi:hypothetical protein